MTNHSVDDLLDTREPAPRNVAEGQRGTNLLESQDMEPSGADLDPRGVEHQSLEPVGMEPPRVEESRGAEPRDAEPRGVDPQGAITTKAKPS